MSPQKLLQLADQAWNDGMESVALDYYEESVKQFRTQKPVDAELISHSLSMLALISKYDGDYEAAVAYYSEGITYLQEGLGPDHKQTIFNLGLKARCLQEMGNLAKAEEVARMMVSSAEVTLAPHHRCLGDALLTLAEILREKGGKEEAESYLRKAIQHELELNGGNSGFYVSYLYILVEWLAVDERIGEAFAVIQEVRAIVVACGDFPPEAEELAKSRYLSIYEKCRPMH